MLYNKILFKYWRGCRVDQSARLESVWTGNHFKSSDPSLRQSHDS